MANFLQNHILTHPSTLVDRHGINGYNFLMAKSAIKSATKCLTDWQTDKQVGYCFCMVLGTIRSLILFWIGGKGREKEHKIFKKTKNSKIPCCQEYFQIDPRREQRLQLLRVPFCCKNTLDIHDFKGNQNKHSYWINPPFLGS